MLLVTSNAIDTRSGERSHVDLMNQLASSSSKFFVAKKHGRKLQRCGQPGQQQGLRMPPRILSRPTWMRRFLVSSFLADVTHPLVSCQRGDGDPELLRSSVRFDGTPEVCRQPVNHLTRRLFSRHRSIQSSAFAERQISGAWISTRPLERIVRPDLLHRRLRRCWRLPPTSDG